MAVVEPVDSAAPGSERLNSVASRGVRGVVLFGSS